MDVITPEAVGTEEESRDRRFCPSRFARSARAKTVVADIIRHIEEDERRVGSRQRRRRPDDQRTFEETVSAVVCDLTHRALTEPGGWLSVPLSNRVLGRAGRYGSRVFGKTLPDLLGVMANQGFLELIKGHQGLFG